MYPKVKVREQNGDDGFVVQEERNSLLLLKVFETLSLHDNSSPGISSIIDTAKKYGNKSPPSIAKVPKSYVPNEAMLISTSKGAGKNDKEIDEDTKPNIRASSVPRPRAVLSSPDNDELIGSRSQLAKEKPSNLKKHNLGQNTPAQSKVKCVKAESPVNTRRGHNEAVDNKSRLNQKKGPELTVPRKKTYLQKGKPSFGV